MSIKEANGTIVINHVVDPVTLVPVSSDPSKGVEVYEFPDSSLAENHVFHKRDLGRTSSSDGLVVQKGKCSVVRETVTTAGRRRTMVQTVNLSANADFTAAETEADIAALGQFLIDNKADLAAGRFSS